MRRESGKLVNIFNTNNELVTSEKRMYLPPIKSEFKRDFTTAIPNLYIGVLDIETYEDNGLAKCFAIGFYTYIDEKCKTFYINEDLDSDELIDRCFSNILIDKYNNIKFYVHNLGRYDGIFIPKTLYRLNENNLNKLDNYKVDSTNRKSDILCLTIKKIVNGKVRTLKLQDSLAILPKSLKDLCEDYNTVISKGLLPYTFCKKDTLFYLGKTPTISYYEDIKVEQYNSLYKED